MKLLRLPGKIALAAYKALCLILFYCNHRLYMRFYLALLKWQGVKIHGTPRYIGIHTKFDDYKRIEIGDKAAISDDCHLLTHDYSITNVFRAIGTPPATDMAIIRNIRIGNNVFIGKKSILMPGCTIGDNCIIGAGAVVRGSIPENSLVIGNPGTIIGSVTDLAEKWKSLGEETIRRDS